MRCTWYYRYPLQVIAVARTANLIFIVLDVLKPLGHKKILEKELEGFGIRYAIFFLFCVI
jgi:ribosome-interacting GTPase 1